VGLALRATAVSPSEIDLVWHRGLTHVNGFEVYRSVMGASGTYILHARLGAAATSYADVGLVGSTEYCYKVRSWRTIGRNTSYSSFAGPACATTLPPPPPPPPPIAAPSMVGVVPVRLDYSNGVSSGLQVTWTDNSSNEDGFRVDRASTATGPWAQAATTTANSTSLFQYGVREEQVCFRVTAFNSSVASNPAVPGCTTPPANPTNLSARATDHSIDLAWSDNSGVEDGYRVSRADSSGVWSNLATLPRDATSYSDAAVLTNATCFYRVQALKDGGSSDYSNEAIGVIATSRPSAPVDLAVNIWSDGEGYGWLYFEASWTGTSTNEQGFGVQISEDGVSGWGTFYLTPSNVWSLYWKYDLYSAAPFGGCYRVIAFNAADDSDPSNVVCTGWGEAPTDLVATAVDQQGIDLTWTDNSRYESGYVVHRTSSPDGPWDNAAFVPPNTTSYRDNGLASGQQYWYAVSVLYANYYSIWDYYNWSSSATATAL